MIDLCCYRNKNCNGVSEDNTLKPAQVNDGKRFFQQRERKSRNQQFSGYCYE